MRRFFFHVITGTSRYEDNRRAMLESLRDVMPQGRTVAKVLTKCWAAQAMRETIQAAKIILKSRIRTRYL